MRVTRPFEHVTAHGCALHRTHIPARVRTYTDVPTAAALAELAYLLVVGPGISLPSLAILSATFRPGLLPGYADFAVACAVVAGVGFDLVVGRAAPGVLRR